MTELSIDEIILEALNGNPVKLKNGEKAYVLADHRKLKDLKKRDDLTYFGFVLGANESVQDYIHKLVKANPDKDASSFKYTIRDTARTVYMGKYKVLDKRKFIKIIKLAAKETGAVVKISGKRIRVIV